MSDNPQTGPERRLQLLLDAHPELMDIPLRAERILNENTRFAIKSAKLYRLADEMKAMLEASVTCRPGCSHCCHMPTMIYQHEAAAMAAAAKCQARKLGCRPAPVALHAALAFLGQACPFLVDGRCAIYAQRPLICRLHNSLNDDPHDCFIPATGKRTPIHAVDADFVEAPYHQAVLIWRPREPWGAIQEFFPTAA
ncbi:MAG: YkgJ family cysteine cluster protein [Gallionellaceae bacterium]|nr:YkgJ family cysteine cluster protein [Gallionellaceae bacterium]